MAERAPPPRNLKQVRLMLWLLVALAVVGVAALLLVRNGPGKTTVDTVQARLGGPFALTGADGKTFSSTTLAGQPYAMFFGFTRCGDVCPTTLSRLVKLRREAAGGDKGMNIVFVTIDPENDGPREVGQYAQLFGAPIIGLTGTQAQIDQVKKQYGIFAQPVAHAPAGQQMQHTGTVLLFDRQGQLAGTISPTEPDGDALAKLKLIA